MSRAQQALAIGLFGATLLALPGIAAAGTPGPTESLGKSKGLEYMRAKHANVVSQVSQDAYCDGDAEATGGGGVINGPAAGTALNETYPAVLDQSGWTSEASSTGSPRKLTTFAVCGGVDVQYYNSQGSLDGGAVSHGPELCPDPETKPIGGGMSATGPGMNLIASRPQRPPSTPGWSVSVWNNTINDTLIDRYALCSDRFELRDRVSNAKELGAGEVGTAIAKCKPSESVLGGGFVGREGEVIGFSTVALGSKPWDSKADGNKVPDDGWQARARNAESMQVDLEAIAVCKRGLVPPP